MTVLAPGPGAPGGRRANPPPSDADYEGAAQLLLRKVIIAAERARTEASVARQDRDKLHAALELVADDRRRLRAVVKRARATLEELCSQCDESQRQKLSAVIADLRSVPLTRSAQGNVE